MGKKDGEERRHVIKSSGEMLSVSAPFLFLKMALALFLPQVHLSPHLLSRKVENAPVWILMKVKVLLSSQLKAPLGPGFFSYRK